ncbi:hypothetical protein A9Q81_27625 [Gammaproteobacteria bacterium 42_54_T18]|nr:hypothetical protein A9Q81_27625 [Gammaproteobacteria bacterium 42_54_T18]
MPSKKDGETIIKLSHYLPVIQASISGFLRFGEGSFDGQKNIEWLNQLMSCSEGSLNLYIQELEAFNQELVDATKT